MGRTRSRLDRDSDPLVRNEDRPKLDWRTSLIGAAAAALLAIFFLTLRWDDGPVGWSYDLLFRFRRNVPVDGVRLVYLDLDSYQRLGQQSIDQRLDRSLHARLLDRLTELKVKTVVFDVLFLGEGKPPRSDEELVQAAKKLGKVATAAIIGSDVLEGRIISSQQTFKPFDRLADATVWGIVEDTQGVSIRQHQSRADFEIPSLAWRAAELTLTNLPADPFRERWINYYGPPGYLSHDSVYQVLSRTNEIDAAAYLNKVVVVGALYSVGFRGGKGTDDFRTPYTLWTGRKSPGAEINATAYLNLARRDWLERLPGPVEALVLLITAAGLVFPFTRSQRPWVTAALAALVSIAMGCAAIALTWSTHVWFPWLLVSAVQIPFAAGWSILANTRLLHAERQKLEIQLAAAQFALSNSESSRKAPQPAELYSSALHRVGRGVPTAPRSVDDSLGHQPFHVPDHEMLKCIGRGSYGEVWLARDVIGTYHAVKVVFRSRFPDAGPFEREFHGIQKFTPISRSHAGFVNILHVGRNDEAGYFYAIMEAGDDANTGFSIDPENYTPRTLANEISRRGKLPASEVAQISIELSSALDHLHRRQLVHGIPKFADIGLVTELQPGNKEHTYLGTAGYIPPEGPGTVAADVFSLGKVMYELATGLDRERFPELPTILVKENEDHLLFALNRIILKACENDLRHRYASAEQLHADLLQIIPLARSVDDPVGAARKREGKALP